MKDSNFLVFGDDEYLAFGGEREASEYAERVIGWSRADGWPAHSRVKIAVFKRIYATQRNEYAAPDGTRYEYRLVREPDERDEQIAAFRDCVEEKDREIAALRREIAALRGEK